MQGYFRRFESRASELGNNRRKYIHGIERHGRKLLSRLEASGRFNRVHLLEPSGDVGREMDAVLESSESEQEKLALLGCYHAIQFLHMNIRSIDFLRSSSPRREDPTELYKKFVQRVRDDFGVLTREYLQRLLDLFFEDVPRPEFVVCTVGTRLHQDDVDIAIIDTGGPDRKHLNRAAARMAQEMMRWTSVPDFYLTEHVGGTGYSVSIEEYGQRLDARILDFVSATETLSATLLTGSTQLFERFKREVHRRYYFKRRGDNHEHEGYLRGILGEIESLLLWPKDPSFINPKDDLLRLVNGILWAYRTVSQIDDADPWDAFQQLSRRGSTNAELFHVLERHYTFVETFRHVYQQFTVHTETIDLKDPEERESLERVARTMGFEDVGVISAWQQLLVHYIEHTRAGQKIVQALVPRIRDHIRKVTVFNDWLRSLTAKGEAATGAAVEFLKRVRYFQGIKYWHDLLDELEEVENGRLEALLEDFKSMDIARRDQVLGTYARWGHQTFFTVFRLLTIFGKNAKRYEAHEIFQALSQAFLGTIEGTADEARRFCTVFTYYPALVYRYLSMADQDTLDFLHEKFATKVWDSQTAIWQERLCCLSEVNLRASQFFKRVLDRVSETHPDCLLNMSNLDELQRASRGILADLVRLASCEEQKIELGKYYDIELLRTGLGTLQALPQEQLDAESTEFSDQYLRLLFETCKTEVDRELGQPILTHDLLALFVAGGHGRERAHQDDYDLIALLNSESAEILRYSNRVLARLNREIVKRGIIPQYRLSDVFSGFVTPFSDLEAFLKERSGEAFVEMSQLLSARMIVGSRRFQSQFRERILRKCIYSCKEDYLQAMKEEILARRRDKKRLGEAMDHDVKESEGGLRDIEMAMLVWKVRNEIEGSIGTRFLKFLAQRFPEHGEELQELRGSYEFLNRLRDLYRLTVCPSNFLDPEHFEQPAVLLGYESSDGHTAAERLQDDFRRHKTGAAATLYRLTGALLEPE